MASKPVLTRRGFVGAIGSTGIGLLPANVTGATKPQQTTSSWPQFQYGAGNTGFNPQTAGPKNSVETDWRFQSGGNTHSSPVIKDNFIFFTSSDSYIYCLDRTAGIRIWRKETNDIPTVPVIVNNLVFSQVSGLALARGAEQFTIVGQSPVTSPTANPNTIVYGAGYSDTSALYATQTDSGEETWFTSDLLLYTVPALANKTVYVGADETLHAIAIGDGSERWSYSIGAEMSSPTVDGETVYVGTADNRLYALDAMNGRFKWVQKTNGSVWSSPAVANNSIFFGSNDTKFYCLNAENGNKRWEFKTGAAVTCSPAIADGVVYFKSQDGNVYALNISDGAKQWQFRIAAKEDSKTHYSNLDYPGKIGLVDVSPAIVDGSIYVVSPTGTLYALSESQ